MRDELGVEVLLDLAADERAEEAEALRLAGVDRTPENTPSRLPGPSARHAAISPPFRHQPALAGVVDDDADGNSFPSVQTF